VPVKEATVSFAPDGGRCHACGHPHLANSARNRGADCLWYAYCPSCGTVGELAAIPAWFGGGLPPPPDIDLH